MDYFHLAQDAQALHKMSNLGLAYLGDAVYEVMVRSWLCLHGKLTPSRLHKAALAYVAAPRQAALMEKLRGQGAADLLSLANAAMPYLQTNLTVAEILAVATTVVGSDDLGNVDTFRLPANDTYVQETRNEQSMFYDCDWAANTSQLYNFIYE